LGGHSLSSIIVFYSKGTIQGIKKRLSSQNFPSNLNRKSSSLTINIQAERKSDIFFKSLKMSLHEFAQIWEMSLSTGLIFIIHCLLWWQVSYKLGQEFWDEGKTSLHALES
jgi:hypothetical protein